MQLSTHDLPVPVSPARLAQHLHDELAQWLTLALMQLDQARHGVDPRAVERAHDFVKRSLRATRETLAQLAEPVPVLELDRALLCQIRQLHLGNDIDMDFVLDGQLPALPPEVAAVLLGATQELLVNACKHGNSARIETRLCARGARLSITVRDLGPGLLGVPLRLAGAGLGLARLRHNLARIGARLRWRSGSRSGVQARINWVAP